MTSMIRMTSSETTNDNDANDEDVDNITMATTNDVDDDRHRRTIMSTTKMTSSKTTEDDNDYNDVDERPITA